jgi:hypothetical protein
VRSGRKVEVGNDVQEGCRRGISHDALVAAEVEDDDDDEATAVAAPVVIVAAYA